VSGEGDAAGGWWPAASIEAIAERARMLASARAFFAERGVMEVETPVLSRHGTTDPAIESLALSADALTPARWLQTSPEFAMKRLLAAGSGPIYQICKVFRDAERGRRHHPEFTLLEWYRPGFSMRGLIDEVAALVRALLERPDLPAETLTYRGLFRSRLGLDPWETPDTALRSRAIDAGIPGAVALALDRDGWLDLLLCHCLESGLGRGALTFLCHYPPSQAALARVVDDGGVPVAERFELYLDGMELANGFVELTDAAEQRLRFDADLAVRRRDGQRTPPMDAGLLAALEAGLPDSAGVALGLDRLLMIRTGAGHIDQVLAFPAERA